MATNIPSYNKSEGSTAAFVQEPSARFQKIAESIGSETGFFTFTIEKVHLDLLMEKDFILRQVDSIGKEYCFIAIRNLLKKAEFLQLSLQLANQSITPDEYEAEIDANPEKYVIQIKHLESPIHLNIISSILNRVGKQFTTDQVSELFSIDIRSIDSGLKAIEKKQ